MTKDKDSQKGLQKAKTHTGSSGKGAKEAKIAGEPMQRSALWKLLGNRKVLLALAILVAIIIVKTWPPSPFGTLTKVKEGIFDRSLEKLDTCKGEADLATRNNCYRDLAFSANKTYFCGKVFNSSSISSSCYAELAVAANSKRACEEIEDVKARSYCTALLAINKAELPLCDNVDDLGWRSYCYTQLAVVLKRPDPCIRIESDSGKADCYFALAKNISSGPTCAYILEQDKRDQCFLAIGTVNLDPLLCAEIAESSSRWTCYQRVAKKTGEVSLCERVPTAFRQNCVDAVKEAQAQRQ